MSGIMTGMMALALAATPATAAELVGNGGFETGDLTGWTASGTVTVGGAAAAHGGTHGAILGGPLSTLNQQLATQPYTYYEISVWLKIPVAAVPVPEFQVYLGGASVIFDYDPGAFGYTDFLSAHVYVTKPKARLSVVRFGRGSPWYVDDISVTGAPYMSMPEPSTWALMLAAFAVVGTVMRRTGRRVRVRA